MPIRTPAAGLAQVGKYILGREQEKRTQKQRIDLELLREEAWHRRLREQQKGQEALRKMLMAQNKVAQEEQTKRGDISQREQTARSKEIQDRMREQQREDARQFDIETHMRKAGTWTAPKPTAVTDTRLKQLNEFSRLRSLYSGKSVSQYNEWGQRIGTEKIDPVPDMVKYYDRLIQDLTGQLTGTQFQQSIQSQITGRTPQELMGSYQEQLLRGGFPQQEAMRLTQGRFQQQQMPQPIGQLQVPIQAKTPDERFIELQQQGKTVDEAYELLKQEFPNL